MHAESIELIFWQLDWKIINKSTLYTVNAGGFFPNLFQRKKMEMTDWYKSKELVYLVVTVYRLKLLGCD